MTFGLYDRLGAACAGRLETLLWTIVLMALLCTCVLCQFSSVSYCLVLSLLGYYAHSGVCCHRVAASVGALGEIHYIYNYIYIYIYLVLEPIT